MTLWRRNSPHKAAQKSDSAADRFRQLKGEIAVLRRQGDLPVKDPGTFSRYLCDLCNTSHPVQELRQCVLCGRYACESCWKDEYYTCKSCAGLIRIHAQVGRE